jgi:hypothetical protein
MTTTDPTKLADDLERGAIRCEALLASDNDIRLAACAVADIVRNNLPTILDALRRPTPPQPSEAAAMADARRRRLAHDCEEMAMNMERDNPNDSFARMLRERAAELRNPIPTPTTNPLGPGLCPRTLEEMQKRIDELEWRLYGGKKSTHVEK